MKWMKWKCFVVAMLLTILVAPLAQAKKPKTIEGAGITIVTGGTGSPSYAPVTTMIGIHWDGTAGTFDCLALAPNSAAGSSGSGLFENNIMYVTGTISSVTFKGDIATITGDANCTGLGAGLGVPFTATAERGGPGVRIVLQVSALTFTETLISGAVSF
jgi:hypothetical protein